VCLLFNVYAYFFFLFLQIAVTKYIRVGSTERNEEIPYFDKSLYEAEIDENAALQHPILTIIARNQDEGKFF